MNEPRYRVCVYTIQYDIHGVEIGESSDLFEIGDGFASVGEARRCIAENADNAIRMAADVERIGPFTAISCDVIARIDEDEYEDGELWDVTWVEDVCLEAHTPKQMAEQIEDYAMSLESRLTGGPDVEMSGASRSFETFYVTWRDCLDDDECEAIDDDGRTTPYCKIRVSTHDPSWNTHEENTANVWLDEYNDVKSLTDAIRNERKRWMETVSEVLYASKTGSRRPGGARNASATGRRRPSRADGERLAWNGKWR